MNRKIVNTIALGIFALVIALSPLCPARAQDSGPSYERMAPIDQYLMTDRKCRDSLCSDRGSPVHRTRCRGLGPRAPRLRNCGQRQERLGVRCGAIVGGSVRRPKVLEPRSTGSALSQSAGRANPPATHSQNDRVGNGWTVQNSDVRQYQSRIRQKGTAAAGTGGDALYDVETAVF
jgi:hypothetical protein